MQEFNDTAHKVLDVAEYYTQTRGFNAFSYKDIQHEVGVKTSSIHYYFPTKQDLAMAMTERYVERFCRALEEITSAHDKGIKQIEVLSRIFIDVLGEGRFCMCGMLASDIVGLPDNVSGKVHEFFQRIEAWLLTAIELAQEQGDVKPDIVAKTAAPHMLAVLEGGMLISRTQKRPNYLETVAQEALAQLKR